MVLSHRNSPEIPSSRPPMNTPASPVLHPAPLLDSFPPLKSVEQLRSKLSAEVASIKDAQRTQFPTLAPISESLVVSPTCPVTDSTVALKDSLGASLSWADRVAIGAKKVTLSYHPPEIRDGKLVVKPPRSVHEEGVKSWEDCLVGSFIGNLSPNYGDIVYTMNKLWGRKGKILVTGVGNNTFLFKIPDSATRD
ncbi:hypothetical protein SLE2022_400760 [Rubroshorea leprosula]